MLAIGGYRRPLAASVWLLAASGGYWRLLRDISRQLFLQNVVFCKKCMLVHLDVFGVLSKKCLLEHFDAFIIFFASKYFVAIGFSTKTCFPFFIAWIACFECSEWGHYSTHAPKKKGAPAFAATGASSNDPKTAVQIAKKTLEDAKKSSRCCSRRSRSQRASRISKS